MNVMLSEIILASKAHDALPDLPADKGGTDRVCPKQQQEDCAQYHTQHPDEDQILLGFGVVHATPVRYFAHEAINTQKNEQVNGCKIAYLTPGSIQMGCAQEQA
ncbi:hypothetical protein D3C80_18940 [compost metagenome]